VRDIRTAVKAAKKGEVPKGGGLIELIQVVRLYTTRGKGVKGKKVKIGERNTNLHPKGKLENNMIASKKERAQDHALGKKAKS